jgi:Cd2+/Zn2+-exporting ATPase
VSHNVGLYVATFLWLLSYVGDWPGMSSSVSLGFHSLSLVSMLWTLPTVSNRALLLLRRGVVDINCLMVLAALGSVAIGDWSEGAAVLALFALGEQLESSATGSARRAIEAIVSLQPEEAVVLVPAEGSKGGDGGALVGVRTHVDEISVGSRIALRPGDCVPLDCRVVSGSSLIDEASLTGESIPVRKKVGDALSGGTVNIGTGESEFHSMFCSRITNHSVPDWQDCYIYIRSFDACVHSSLAS